MADSDPLASNRPARTANRLLPDGTSGRISRELAVSHRVLLSFRTRGNVFQPPI
jgi:hypothetical protein